MDPRRAGPRDARRDRVADAMNGRRRWHTDGLIVAVLLIATLAFVVGYTLGRATS
jgi:hypothetical protein